MGNGAHGAIVYRGMGYREYRPHGLWGTGGMAHMGNGVPGAVREKRAFFRTFATA